MSEQRQAPGRWRWATAVVVLLAAALLVVSYQNADGTDLRPGRYNNLATLVNNEGRRVKAQQEEVAALTREIDRMGGSVQDAQVREKRAQAEAVSASAGLQPVIGEAVTIVLSDSPPDEVNATNIDLNRFVVHQQDIQSVVNALWVGGARAVTVQGQRIITTSAIKCEGSLVTLQGVPYPQPYVISGVGDLAGMLAAIESDIALADYRADASNPAIGIGWDLSTQVEATAPAYDGVVDLTFAKAAG